MLPNVSNPKIVNNYAEEKKCSHCLKISDKVSSTTMLEDNKLCSQIQNSVLEFLS